MKRSSVPPPTLTAAEVALLAAFRGMDAGDADFILRLSQSLANEIPKPRYLRLVETGKGGVR
jgi:hypothetical protein